jgi:hypothetical protein
MQTYTHLLIGAFVASYLAADDQILLATCVVGSVMPDIPSALVWAKEKAKDKTAFKNISSRFLLIAEVFHSIPLSIALTIFFYSIARMGLFDALTNLIISYLPLFTLCASLHQAIDALTHSRKFYSINFFWPWKFEINKLLSLWEYRTKIDGIRPKWQEAVLDIFLLLSVSYLRLMC